MLVTICTQIITVITASRISLATAATLLTTSILATMSPPITTSLQMAVVVSLASCLSTGYRLSIFCYMRQLQLYRRLVRLVLLPHLQGRRKATHCTDLQDLLFAEGSVHRVCQDVPTVLCCNMASCADPGVRNHTLVRNSPERNARIVLPQPICIAVRSSRAQLVLRLSGSTPHLQRFAWAVARVLERGRPAQARMLRILPVFFAFFSCTS
jgi:hypothetical protein